MPKVKVKTHSGAKKRFSVTKNGKIKRSSAFRGHDIKGCKSSKRKRQLRSNSYTDSTNAATIKKLVPYK